MYVSCRVVAHADQCQTSVTKCICTEYRKHFLRLTDMEIAQEARGQGKWDRAGQESGESRGSRTGEQGELGERDRTGGES